MPVHVALLCVPVFPKPEWWIRLILLCTRQKLPQTDRNAPSVRNIPRHRFPRSRRGWECRPSSTSWGAASIGDSCGPTTRPLSMRALTRGRPRVHWRWGTFGLTNERKQYFDGKLIPWSETCLQIMLVSLDLKTLLVRKCEFWKTWHRNCSNLYT